MVGGLTRAHRARVAGARRPAIPHRESGRHPPARRTRLPARGSPSPRAPGGTVRSASAAAPSSPSGFVSPDLELICGPDQLDARGIGTAVLERVRQGLLDDPIRGLVDGLGQVETAHPRAGHADREACPMQLVRQVVELCETRCSAAWRCRAPRNVTSMRRRSSTAVRLAISMRSSAAAARPAASLALVGLPRPGFRPRPPGRRRHREARARVEAVAPASPARGSSSRSRRRR